MYFTLFLAAIGAFLLYRAIVLMLSDCDLKLRSHAKLPYNAFKGKTAWIVGASSGSKRFQWSEVLLTITILILVCLFVCLFVGLGPCACAVGEALAVELAGRGCRVILSARREDELQRVAERCKAVGAPEARVLPLDALAFDTHEAAVNTIYEEWQWRVDYFVSVAAPHTAQGHCIGPSCVVVPSEADIPFPFPPLLLLPSFFPPLGGQFWAIAALLGSGNRLGGSPPNV